MLKKIIISFKMERIINMSLKKNDSKLRVVSLSQTCRFFMNSTLEKDKSLRLTHTYICGQINNKKKALQID